MDWTAETPKEAGYYWYWHQYSSSAMPELRRLHEHDGGLVEVQGGVDYVPAASFRGYWYGPIEIPALPKVLIGGELRRYQGSGIWR